MNVYKIRRKSDNKFSSGARPPAFTDGGIFWPTSSSLRNHLSMFKYGDWGMYEGCEVVQFTLQEIGTSDICMDEIMDLYKDDAIVRALQGD